MSYVKFVDNNNFYILLNGPTISIYTSFGLSAFSIIEINNENELVHGSYFYISSPNKTYCVWFDMIGDTPPDDIDINIDIIRVDMSSGTITENLISTFDTLSEFNITLTEDNLLELQCALIGNCNAPHDYNTGFNFLYQLNGYNPNSLVKTSQFGKSVVEILDADYTSSTDTLELVIRKFKRTELGKDIGYLKEFDLSYKSIKNWFFGY
jgi:hypothetical protein